MSSKIAKVAIILGFYNGNKFLVEQLKSIISQTQNNLKIFIFNDKSTQKILNLEKAYLRNSNRKITLVNRKENHGFAKTFFRT